MRLSADPGEFFSLDEETGVLSTAKKLDRESSLVQGGAIRLAVKVSAPRWERFWAQALQREGLPVVDTPGLGVWLSKMACILHHVLSEMIRVADLRKCILSLT